MSQQMLRDQVVLIIGAGRAPAQEIALALSAQGAIIAANDFSPVLLDRLAEAVRTRGGRIHTYVADATRGMPLRAMLDEVIEDLGGIDILVNNPRVRPETSLLQIDEYDWQRAVDVNLNGPFLVTQLVARGMQEQGYGIILNIVDTSEDQGSIVYAASQQGLLALSRGAARELIAYNIRVYTFCPDETVFSTEEPESGGTAHTLGRLAAAVCSQKSPHLSGLVFQVNRSEVHPQIDWPGENDRPQE